MGKNKRKGAQQQPEGDPLSILKRARTCFEEAEDFEKMRQNAVRRMENAKSLYIRVVESELPQFSSCIRAMVEDSHILRKLREADGREAVVEILKQNAPITTSGKAWEVPYDDPADSVTSLLNQIDAANNKFAESLHAQPNATPIYKLVLSLTQASGTGKSRGLVQLKTRGVYVCYCSFQSGGGVPLKSGGLAERIEEYCHNDLVCNGLIRAWLVVLRTRWTKWNTKGLREGLCEAWSKDHVLKEPGQSSEVIQDVCDEWDNNPACTEDELRSAVDGIKHFTRNNGVRVLFIFDESRHLFHNGIARYLRRAFNDPGIVGVFVDTKASVSTIAPPAAKDPSLRPQLGQSLLLPPIWQLRTMNCSAPDLNKIDYPNEKELFDFGRPLWAAERKQDTQLVQLAAAKLVGGIPMYNLEKLRQGEGVEREQAVAVLGARLAIDVVPQGELAAELAAGYMSLLLDVSEDRAHVTVCEPWDPVLAAAACTFTSNEKFRLAALRHLEQVTKSYLVDEGKNGELLARYILMRARDRCVEAAGKGYTDSVSFGDFMGRLLGTSINHRNRRVCKPISEVLGPELNGACINFNSFISVTYTPNMEDMKVYWKLRKAVVCKTDQPLFDAIIPVQLSDGTMSVAACQFKSRVEYSPTDFDASRMSVDPEFSAPHVAIFMSLASEVDVKSYVPLLGCSTRSGQGNERKEHRVAFVVEGVSYDCLVEDEVRMLSRLVHFRRTPFKQAMQNDLNFLKSMMPYGFPQSANRRVTSKAAKEKKSSERKRHAELLAAKFEKYSKWGLTCNMVLNLIDELGKQLKKGCSSS